MIRHVISLALLVAVCLLSGGCTDLARGTGDTLKLVWQGTPRLSPTAEQVAAKPYYQLRATTARGDAILILGNVDGNREYWYGANGVALVLEHGRIVQTIGLPENLDRSVANGPDPFAAGLHTMRSPSSYERIDDRSPGYRYGLIAHVALTPAGDADINILGTHHHVLLINEHASTPATHESVHNRYWVDPTDGFIWMSEQEATPGFRITLVALRPYRDVKP